MKMKLSIIFSMLLLIGAAGAVVELSGTDPAVFDQPVMAKEGVVKMAIAAEVWQTPYGWNNPDDGRPFGNVSPLLTGSVAKAAYMSSKEKAALPDYAAQVEAYLDEQLNRSSANVSPDEW